MTRGKYGARAEGRREVTELAERAVKAERDRDRLAAELAALRERSDAVITGLRAQASELREQRDEAASPRIAELEAANNRLRAQRDATAAAAKGLRSNVRLLLARHADFLAERLGIPRTEAMELVNALGGDPASGTRVVLGDGVASSHPKVVEAVQQARGIRREGTAAAVSPAAQPVVVAQDGRSRLPASYAVLEDCLAEAYAYDGPRGSVSIGAVDGELWVRVECAEADIVADEFIMTVPLPASEGARLAEAIGRQPGGTA